MSVCNSHKVPVKYKKTRPSEVRCFSVARRFMIQGRVALGPVGVWFDTQKVQLNTSWSTSDDMSLNVLSQNQGCVDEYCP